MAVELTVVFDNWSDSPGLATAWGFACVVTGLQRTILFDTGSDGNMLIANMRSLGIAPEKIDAIMISHSHYDHAGGLLSAVREITSPQLFVPADSFPEVSTQTLRKFGAQISHPPNGHEICKDAFAVDTRSDFWREQSLAVTSGEETALITGCAHPGIVNIAQNAYRTLKRDLTLVLGGFHLVGTRSAKVREIADELKRLSARKIAPAHCTGEEAREVLQEEFQEGFLKIGVGSRITLG